VMAKRKRERGGEKGRGRDGAVEGRVRYEVRIASWRFSQLRFGRT